MRIWGGVLKHNTKTPFKIISILRSDMYANIMWIRGFLLILYEWKMRESVFLLQWYFYEMAAEGLDYKGLNRIWIWNFIYQNLAAILRLNHNLCQSLMRTGVPRENHLLTPHLWLLWFLNWPEPDSSPESGTYLKENCYSEHCKQFSFK